MPQLQRPHRGTRFALSEKDIWPGCREIEVEGELDLATSGRLRAAIERAREERHHLLVNLSRCNFIDASALTVLVDGHQSLREHGRQLLLYGVQGQVRRLLSITGVTETGLMATTATPDAPPAYWSDRLGTNGIARSRSCAGYSGRSAYKSGEGGVRFQ
jgi:anti-sigma B factor antagonist